ncbi:MAG TPA: endonuclease/exonuclease/phosphatase family protein [Anaerolineales bacterium]|nr:endonuclease/exonuclease/phosphatase family protein [Anaerolineales bacterium]
MNPPTDRTTLRSLRELALPALSVTFGLQLLRVLLPSLVWYLQDTRGAGSISLAVFAFGVFLLGFLAAFLRRLAGPRLSLWITAGGLAIVRLVEQINHMPLWDLVLSMTGTALFVLFLPIFVGHVRATAGDKAAPRLAFGWLLGLALDTAIKGATGTLDLSWIPGPISLLTVLGLAGATPILVAAEPHPDRDTPSEVHWRQAWPLLALGPGLFLEMLVLQNQGWVSQVGGISSELAFVWVMAGNLLAALGAWAAPAWPRSRSPLLGLMAAALLLLFALSVERPGGWFLAGVLAAHGLIGWGWSLVAQATQAPGRSGLGRTTAVMGSSMVMFLLLTFIYYVSFDLPLPIQHGAMPPTAAVLFGAAILAAALSPGRSVSPRPTRSVFIPAGALLFVPIIVTVASASGLGPSPHSGMPVKIMTYNIHSAFNTDARQDLEAIAQVIEASGADLIAMQEVSRGWMIDGSTDLVAWLSRRLKMEVFFSGTADPVWGNAMLSRYPIGESGSGLLPREGTVLQRGYLWAMVNLDEATPLFIMNTHLHHIESQHEPRLAQVKRLLEYWDGRELTVLLGDLNSEPGYPEMALIEQAGFIDSWAEAGSGPGYTWHAADPFERIDWIWHTADLQATSAEVLRSTASDHLPLVVTLERR